MDELLRSRRSLLGGLAGGATLGLAGCVDGLLGGGSRPDVGPVPQGVDLLVGADVDTLLADDGLRRLAEAVLAARVADGSDPTEIPALADALAGTYGLDPVAVSAVTGFGTIDPADPRTSTAGAIVSADWEAVAIPSALREAGFPITERQLGEVTLYDLDREVTSVAVLEEGRYVVATDDAARAVAAVHNGEADPVDNDLLSQYGTVGEGPVRFASRFSPLVESIVTLAPGDGDYLRAQLLDQMETVTGRIVVDGQRRGFETRFRADDANTAEDFEAVVRALRGGAASQAPADGPVPDALNSVSVEQDGDTVRIAYSGTVERLETVAAALVPWLVGTGPLGLPLGR